MKSPTPARVRALLQFARHRRLLVVGDVMLDRFIWGHVDRISPEAPVPVVEHDHESQMPGGAANVARNLTALGAPTALAAVVGPDRAGRELRALLQECAVDCAGVLTGAGRVTSVKMRIIAQRQQVVRVDHESRGAMPARLARQLARFLEHHAPHCAAVIVGDYGKGVVSQPLLDALKGLCRARGVWLSLDPKPVHRLNLAGLSLLTPNRKEAFDLAGLRDGSRHSQPLQDEALQAVAQTLLRELQPALLLITLGDQGMLLCQRNHPPVHIPTMAQEVFDVSGAGDTVMASFTLAIAAGASPLEAAILSNHAAGVVVGKVGTATVSPEELLESLSRQP